jgi:hypothetical protein
VTRVGWARRTQWGVLQQTERHSASYKTSVIRVYYFFYFGCINLITTQRSNLGTFVWHGNFKCFNCLQELARNVGRRRRRACYYSNTNVILIKKKKTGSEKFLCDTAFSSAKTHLWYQSRNSYLFNSWTFKTLVSLEF